MLSVPPAHRDAVADLLAGLDADAAAQVIAARLPALLRRPEQVCFTGVFRWSQTPAALPGAGEWEPSDGPGIPDWLRPFPGEVLIARDGDGAYLAGVGLKPHDVSGIEISVGTAERARGQGLARRLVARAARRIVAGGAVAIYLHDPGNTASARVADAAGFPDLITGGVVYRGCRMPGYHGTYFYGDYCTGMIRSFRLVNGQPLDQRDWTAPLSRDIGNISSFGVDADGEVHIVDHGGAVYRVQPAP